MSNIKISFSSRQLTQFFLITFLWALVEGMLMFYMPIFIDSQLGSVLFVGLFLGLNSIASLFSDVIFGFVSQMSDYRKFIFGSLLISVVTVPLLLIQGSWISILIIVLLWGVQYEMFSNFGSTLFLAKHAPHGDFELVSSTNFVLRNIGFFFGPILADYLRGHSDLFVVIALGLFVLINLGYVYVSLISYPGPHHKVKARHLSVISEIEIIRKHFRKILPYMILGFGLASVEAVFFLFGPLEFSKTTDIAGLVTSVGLLANVIIPPLLFGILRKSGARKLLGYLAIGISVSAILLWLNTTIWLLMLILFLIFSMLALALISKDSLFLKSISRIAISEGDEVVSMNSFGVNVAYVLTALIGGIVINAVSFELAVMLGSLVLLVCTLLFILLTRKQHDSSRATSKMHR